MTASPPYELSYDRRQTRRGFASRTPTDLPDFWTRPANEPFDYSPDSDRPSASAPVLEPHRLWTPQPGPQTEACESEADEILFGGEPGGGKTDWLLGFSLTRHRQVQMFRREATQLDELVSRLREITEPRGYSPTGRLVTSPRPRWTYQGHRITLAGLKDDNDAEKWQGRAGDGKAFDELTHFTLSQYLTITGWGRSTDPSVRSQTYATCNPPVDEDAVWITQRWRPWLDPHHQDPAQSGELRYFAMIDGVDTECESGEPFEWTSALTGETEWVYPSSRTFIRSRLSDNAYLGEAYRRKIDALPEPMRTIYKTSNFMAMLQSSHPTQVIPTAWIRAAQARWRPERPEHPDGRGFVPLSAMSLDVAEGGKDRTVLGKRYDWWVDRLTIVPGIQTPTAEDSVKLVTPHLLEGGYVIVDADGVGGKAWGKLSELVPSRAIPFNGVAKTVWRDVDRQLTFFNVRAAAYWCLRQALDPERGSRVALPPDSELLSELSAVRWKWKAGGQIILEDKEKEIKPRLGGKSPDLADMLAMLFWDGWALLDRIPDQTRVEVAL